MAAQVNPGSTYEEKDYSSKQTVEFRCPDGSANVYLLMAGLTVAARHGLLKWKMHWKLRKRPMLM
jgi:glutamine synthetase